MRNVEAGIQKWRTRKSFADWVMEELEKWRSEESPPPPPRAPRPIPGLELPTPPELSPLQPMNEGRHTEEELLVHMKDLAIIWMG